MSTLWDRYQKYLLRNDALGVSLDISRMRFGDDFLPKMEPLAQQAFVSMKALEAGAIANPDEKRMVGHYWLRAPQLAPTPELKADIENCNQSIRDFVAQVYASGRFTDVLVIGIGGSALGPQFVSDALGTDDDRLRLHFFDNTDPDGIDRTLVGLQHRIEHTLVVVISKSGGTPETRNGMLEAEAAFGKAGVNFARNAVAVTGVGSALDKIAEKGGWLARFPMWDWVGGRTSIMSAVGLVPLCLQGIDMQSLLDGARAMDEWTRTPETLKNPAMLLAFMWHFAGNGRGGKDMVVLPYKDRLALYSKYLQQLVMESLGKAHDLDGKEVHQGIAVYGNKGSTDQHAYVQQLRDGVPNFFATFIEVRKDRAGQSIEVEPGFTSGDFLQGFLRGTRAALYEGGRDSLTISIPEVTPFQVGALIALYDRAVGFYASLVNINAYHQPGVEAGKKAAAGVLKTLASVHGALSATPQTASQIAATLVEDAEAVFHALNHLAANDSRVQKQTGETPGARYFPAGLMSKLTQTNNSTDTITVPFPRITGLVRQLTHDVRNGLNNVDLQAAFLQEIVTDPQAVPEIKRLRGMVTDAAKMLQSFSASFWLPEPSLVTYSAAIFIEDFQNRLAKLLPEQAREIQWTVKLGNEAISVDIEMLFRGLAEFFKNAFHFREGTRPIDVAVSAEKGRLVIEICESKSAVPSSPATWGCEPLVSTRRSGFGMGLFYARQVIAIHGGEVAATFDPAAERLTTHLSLPLVAR